MTFVTPGRPAWAERILGVGDRPGEVAALAADDLEPVVVAAGVLAGRIRCTRPSTYRCGWLPLPEETTLRLSFVPEGSEMLPEIEHGLPPELVHVSRRCASTWLPLTVPTVAVYE